MLSVSNGRSRDRSKSRERSRSRDVRAPSPARAVSPPRSSKSKSSKSKKYHSPSSSESSEATESESDSDRRSRRKRDESKYDSKGRSRQKSPSSDDDSEEERRRYAREKENKDKDRGHDRYGAEPARYEYAQPGQTTRHMSYADDRGHGKSYEVPGGFVNYPEGHPEHTRHMSINSPTGYQDPNDPNRPPYASVNTGGRPQYQVPGKYEYAQPSHSIQYIPKSAVPGPQGYAGYVATPHTQIMEVERKSSRRDKDDDKYDDRHKSSRKDKDRDYKDRDYKDKERDYRDRDYKDEKKKKSRRDDESDDDRRKPSRRGSDSDHDRRKPSRRDSELEKHKSTSSRSHRGSEPQVVEIHPGGSSLGAPAIGSRMHRLSVSGVAPGALALVAPGGYHQMHAGALPPGSPLLEAYRGTYQSISPMPSPMALAHGMDDDMSDLEPLEADYSSDDSRHARGPRSILKKRVSIYDPEPDALAIAAELKHAKPGAGPLIKILPLLSDDNIMALRTEYKKHFKTNGKGINIAKHIKLKVIGNIGKAAYATALGRWESEAYWSNFWYQSNTSRRELLIESLVGRSNVEIRKIKEAFSDKRYNDSLEKCMQTELKRDKFRTAVLLAIEGRRQDELERLSVTRIENDVRDLYKALVAKEGGETAMIEIIVVRSDLHLRQVLQGFEAKYKRNFAREMIQKSKNLVGETLAHILNGVLNRPVRDALLLHQALAETSKDRAELLVSRLVRYHWEPKHLERIKVEYRRKYGTKLERDVEEGTKGDFGEFCLALCQGATR